MSASARIHLRHRLEERRREARGGLGGGDLAHLADVAAGLRRRRREPPLDARDELGRAVAKVCENVLEDAVRVRGEQRLQRAAPVLPL